MADETDKKIAELEAQIAGASSHMKVMDLTLQIQKLKDAKAKGKAKASWEM
jgi:hypothetical protein